MSKELNNLVSFSDFTKSWKSEGAKKTARTETGLDVLAQSGRGVDVDTKKVTDKSTTAPGNGLSKDVIKTQGGHDAIGMRHVKDTSKTSSNGLAKVVVK
jgi:hypothetical protein